MLLSSSITDDYMEKLKPAERRQPQTKKGSLLAVEVGHLNSCCAEKLCSNPQILTLNPSCDPKVSKDTKYIKFWEHVYKKTHRT